MEVLFTTGSVLDNYVCPLCSAFVVSDWGFECAPVIDCDECNFVGVLAEEPDQMDRTAVKTVRLPLRHVKHVRVDNSGKEAAIEPPCMNAYEGAKIAGIDIVSGGVMWLTTTDGVEHGYFKMNKLAAF